MRLKPLYKLNESLERVCTRYVGKSCAKRKKLDPAEEIILKIFSKTEFK